MHAKSNRTILVAVAGPAILLGGGSALAQTGDAASERYLMVRWRSVEQADAARDHSPFLAAVRARIHWTSRMLPEWSVIEIPQGTVLEAQSILGLDPTVDRVEREPIVRPCTTTPNDDFWPQQQPILDPTNIRCAWDKIMYSETLVAVLDDGVNYDHPDLYDNIWKNTAELYGSPGKDDDGDGIVDDIYGASFLPHTDLQWVADGDPRGNMLEGSAGHGTAMASIMGAIGSNEPPSGERSYICGAFWIGQMLPVQVYSFDDHNGFAVMQGMEYAYLKGARIMNCSFEIYAAFEPEWMKDFILATPDVLYVSAAGNRGVDLDAPGATLGYPQCFNIDNILVLGGTEPNDDPWDFYTTLGTNWGSYTVDLFAPAWPWILLRDPLADPVGNEPGTSNAAAFTSGIAAMLWTLHPSWTALDIKQRIMDTADPVSALSGLCVTGGRLNAAEAVGQTCP